MEGTVTISIDDYNHLTSHENERYLVKKLEILNLGIVNFMNLAEKTKYATDFNLIMQSIEKELDKLKNEKG